MCVEWWLAYLVSYREHADGSKTEDTFLGPHTCSYEILSLQRGVQSLQNRQINMTNFTAGCSLNNCSMFNTIILLNAGQLRWSVLFMYVHV